MSGDQFHQTVAQEQEWREECDRALMVEMANQLAQVAANDEHRQRLLELYPQIRAVWPGRDKK